MTDSAVSSALDYYARIGASLFPIPAGSKEPFGIVGSFARDCSADPAQWAAWAAANPGCNWGVVAGPSRLVIVDIDTKAGRDAAWALWCELCATWGIAVVMPHVQSARGGWHVLFRVPDNVDAATLRQPDAIKGLINVRAGNGYTVAAGSYYDGTAKGEASGAYSLLPAAAEPLYQAPAALVEHCARRTRETPSTAVVGSSDAGDVAALLTWLNVPERNAFAAYEDWVGVGMALKLEFGDAGLDLWRLTHDETVTPDIESTKWHSFTTEPAPGVQTLRTWLARAHKLGWRGSVRKSTAAMFGDVAQLAAKAGASLPIGTALPAGTPGPTGGASGGMPMLAGQEKLTEYGAPILRDFLSSTVDFPSRPATNDYPTLPEGSSGHGLYAAMQDTIARMVAMAEVGKGWKASRVIDPLSVLACVHKDVFDSVCRKLNAFGVTVPSPKIKLATAALEDRVQRAFVQNDQWIMNTKGEIEHDNSDNVAVFLGVTNCETRWNAWKERAEIRSGLGGEWPTWTYVDDSVIAKLRTRGNRSGTRFRPAKDFFWESMVALAQQNTVDPARDMLDRLQAEWDGTPRLVVWLTRACGVACDPYHQSVGKLLVGSIVRRIREPGCKQDEIVILYGPQGTGKSTLARILAFDEDHFSDEIMLGDASKELVLSLAGKSVVEIAEMGMRGSANAAQVKAMLSRQVDRGRTAYARSVSERPRRNVFIGTTNEDEPLTDPTGNRRFLPVLIDREIDLTWLRQNVAQLLGEAGALQAQGETFGLPREIWQDAAVRQDEARNESDTETMFAEWFGETQLTTGQPCYITAADLATLVTRAGFRLNGSRSTILKRLGFRKDSGYVGGKKSKLWIRGDVSPSIAIEKGIRYVVGTAPDGTPRVQMRLGAGVG